MKVGFLGGTFDPIHFGHLNLAIEMQEIHELGRVFFCPVYCSPFKQDAPPVASPRDRLEMLKRALERFDDFLILETELEKREPSYTIDTIRELHKKYPKLHLLLSQDAASHFEYWKEAKELLRIAPPLIGKRKGAPPISGPFAAILEKGETETRILEISSTEIRERLFQKKTVRHLVPEKVLDYIEKHTLYSPL